MFVLCHDSAAVYVKRLAGYVAARVAGEKGHGFGDVLRFSGMAERNSFSCGFPFSDGVSRPDPFGSDPAGSYDVSAHIIRRKLEG